MFLLERLVGVSLYILLLLITCLLLARGSKTKAFRNRVLALYLMSISVLAYLYLPYETADLYRLIDYMWVYTNMTMPEFLDSLSTANAPVTMIYYRVIGSLGLPGLLAGVTTFLVFNNIFYIIKDITERLKASGSTIALALFTVMSTGLYMQAVGNIRTMLAFSIIARAFYSEAIQGRHLFKNIPWYLIACLIHPAAIVAVSIRVTSLLLVRVRERRLRSALLITASVLVVIAALAVQGSSFIDNVFEKADVYVTEVAYTYIWDTIITLLSIVVISISWITSRKNSNLGHIQRREVANMSLLLTIFSLTAIFEHATFVRFTQLNLIISLPLIIAALQTYKKTGRRLSSAGILRTVAIILPVIILAISASRGALSSLKFFIV